MINDSCPSKLQSQHSAENLTGTQGKFESKLLDHEKHSSANPWHRLCTPRGN